LISFLRYPPPRPESFDSENEGGETEDGVLRDNYSRYVNEIRSTILEHGYRDALSAWVRSVPIRMMTAENQEEAFRFFLWTRNLFIIFERYGAEGSREVLELMDPDMIRPGHWSQTAAFDAWLGHRNSSNATEEARQALRGWIKLTRIELERGRTYRARMHSMDAVSDVLFERTDSDAEFIAVHGEVRYSTEDERPTERGPSATAGSVLVVVPEEVPEPVVEVNVSATIEESSAEL
jgi:hypothetical protein